MKKAKKYIFPAVAILGVILKILILRFEYIPVFEKINYLFDIAIVVFLYLIINEKLKRIISKILLACGLAVITTAVVVFENIFLMYRANLIQFAENESDFGNFILQYFNPDFGIAKPRYWLIFVSVSLFCFAVSLLESPRIKTGLTQIREIIFCNTIKLENKEYAKFISSVDVGQATICLYRSVGNNQRFYLCCSNGITPIEGEKDAYRLYSCEIARMSDLI